MHLCKTSAVVQKLYDTDRALKFYFVKTRLCGVHDGETETQSICSAVQSSFKPVDM
jgi:hypothetical protein